MKNITSDLLSNRWLLNLSIGFVTAVVVPFSAFVLPSNSQSKRPVYVIAHRCNAGSWVKNVVQKQGVNAIEADFMYGTKNGVTGWFLAHDDLSGNRETLDAWLNAVSQAPLALLHVDIKTPDAPLDELFDKIRAKLPSVNLIFDIGLVKDGKYLTPIKSRILNDPRAVAAMGFDDSPTDVNNFFQNAGYPLNKYWYEIGVAAGLVWSKTEQDWTREAIKARDAGLGPKVVIWTFENKSTVNYWLEQGVDGILVNSSQCFGLAGTGSDADVHVASAKKLTNAEYGTRSNAFGITTGSGATVSDNRMSYDVTIKTGDKTGAGTDSNIYLTLDGVLGRTREIQINQFISGNAFERNQTDRFTLKNIKTIGEFPRSIKIRSDGKFAGAAWYLESITINGKTARFDRWIESGKLEVSAPMN
ncbi:PLAT/LH2 domain-containing protein [Chamaesiphon sp.]|uniref:PLAT/LH2 domain-containing protein n=1 Tax=Chamaesiphon sp. TaxID=2814140 RepID=UPI0035942767